MSIDRLVGSFADQVMRVQFAGEIESEKGGRRPRVLLADGCGGGPAHFPAGVAVQGGDQRGQNLRRLTEIGVPGTAELAGGLLANVEVLAVQKLVDPVVYFPGAAQRTEAEPAFVAGVGAFRTKRRRRHHAMAAPRRTALAMIARAHPGHEHAPKQQRIKEVGAHGSSLSGFGPRKSLLVHRDEAQAELSVSAEYAGRADAAIRSSPEARRRESSC